MAIKGKTEELLVKKTQDLWKENARTHWVHQKTKHENPGHWRIRGASKSNV
jgi:hypothetical protein